MDSDKNGLDNLLNNLNEERTVDTTSPFYQLLEKQAKEFELFGQRLRSEVQNTYQELVKLQHEQPVQTNHEIATDFQKSQQIINEIAKFGDAQSELIDALKARVEELEIDSIVKDQDIKNLRQDIKSFLEFNRLQVKKSDTKGKSVDIVDEKRDYEGVTWADSVCDKELNWWINVENENLLNNLKSTHAESSNSSSNHFSSFFSQTDRIHIKVQEIINRRENLSKIVREKHFRVLERDFTTDDLIQYTKSENYNSLSDNNKRIINNFLTKKLANESSNQDDKVHVKIQDIISRRENFDKKVRERHFNVLIREFTYNDLIQYTKSEYYNSLSDNFKRMINNFLMKKWANEREDKTNESKGIQQIHNRILGIIARRESLSKNVKRRNLKFLTREFTYNDLYQYTKSGKFTSLNKKVKKIINDFVHVEHVNISSATNVKSTNVFPSQIDPLFSEDQESTSNLHSQIQQIILQKEQLGFKVRLKHFKALEISFTIDDFIQYAKTNQFDSLDANSKRLLNLLIYEILSREFKQKNITLSQDFDEYVKRGVIPELPPGYNNYTMYKESDMFDKLNKILKERVQKLVKLEAILESVY